MLYPKVTVIVVPHQCFDYTQKSLESIYKYTNIPFKLIYIDGYSPKNHQQYLEKQSREKGFSLIRTDKYVTSNQARNIGLQQVDTEYVVFINNDILVNSGWLNTLIQCMEETNASVVKPVCLEGEKQLIHSAGGSLEFHYRNGNLDLFDERLFVKSCLDETKSLLRRKPTQIIDLNCVLVRTSILKKIGSLDENLRNCVQDIDFCLSIFAVGGTIYIEPQSIVNYLPVTELKLSDIPYYMLIWNYVWKRKSVNHFQEKWGLSKDSTFLTNILKKVNQPKILPFQSFKKLIEPLYTYENTSLNHRVFKRS
ncbi:MAG: glycosyltransferase [Cyanobacteriota bacterium]|nr:glycosyltransferase [Cyanobacteriota bacterium]